MKVLRSAAIAFSMYSKLPVPTLQWREDDMRYVMALFPFVGVIIGGLIYLWGLFCAYFEISPLIQGAGFFLIPLAITGGIHLDGFCDTCDAMGSHGDKEKKLDIMKDPRMGAFGAIGLVAYSILYLALASGLSVDKRTVLCFSISFVLTRALSGLSVVLLPCAKGSGLARTFADAASRKVCGVCLCILALCAGWFMVYFGGFPGVIAIAFALLTFIFYELRSRFSFGGITGDLAGWFLQICEIAILLALTMIPQIGAKLF